MVKTFDLLEQYKKQGEENHAKRATYVAKVEAAKEKVDELKIQLDEVLHIEMANGTDKSKEKESLRKQIEQAEKEHEVTQEEFHKLLSFLSTQGAKIKRPDVVQEWLKTYFPSVQAQDLPPIKERITYAHNLLVSALYDLYRLQGEYRFIVNEVKEIDRAAHEFREQDCSYGIRNPFELAEVAAYLAKIKEDIQRVHDTKTLPNHITYIDAVK